MVHYMGPLLHSVERDDENCGRKKAYIIQVGFNMHQGQSFLQEDDKKSRGYVEVLIFTLLYL